MRVADATRLHVSEQQALSDSAQQEPVPRSVIFSRSEQPMTARMVPRNWHGQMTKAETSASKPRSRFDTLRNMMAPQETMLIDPATLKLVNYTNAYKRDQHVLSICDSITGE